MITYITYGNVCNSPSARRYGTIVPSQCELALRDCPPGTTNYVTSRRLLTTASPYRLPFNELSSTSRAPSGTGHRMTCGTSPAAIRRSTTTHSIAALHRCRTRRPTAASCHASSISKTIRVNLSTSRRNCRRSSVGAVGSEPRAIAWVRERLPVASKAGEKPCARRTLVVRSPCARRALAAHVRWVVVRGALRRATTPRLGHWHVQSSPPFRLPLMSWRSALLHSRADRAPQSLSANVGAHEPPHAGRRQLLGFHQSCGPSRVARCVDALLCRRRARGLCSRRRGIPALGRHHRRRAARLRLHVASNCRVAAPLRCGDCGDEGGLLGGSASTLPLHPGQRVVRGGA